MKLEFNTIYYGYLNESPFKYYISILGGRSKAMLILLIWGGGARIWETLLIEYLHAPLNKKLSLAQHNFLAGHATIK